MEAGRLEYGNEHVIPSYSRTARLCHSSLCKVESYFHTTCDMTAGTPYNMCTNLLTC